MEERKRKTKNCRKHRLHDGMLKRKGIAMGKMISWILWSIHITALIASYSLNAEAKSEPALMEMYTTAYCQGEITASGQSVREGICAVKRNWMGKTVIIYENDDGEIGNLLAIHECLDTGFGGDSDGDGVGSIQEGKVIDVYFPTLEKCKEWMELTNGKCFVQLVEAEG